MKDFTRRALKILYDYSHQEAKQTGELYPCAEHILLGMLRSEDFQFLRELVVGTILDRLGVNARDLVARIVEQRHANRAQRPLARDCSGVVEGVVRQAREEARKLGHACVGSEHILLTILCGENSDLVKALTGFGLTYERVRAVLADMHA